MSKSEPIRAPAAQSAEKLVAKAPSTTAAPAQPQKKKAAKDASSKAAASKGAASKGAASKGAQKTPAKADEAKPAAKTAPAAKTKKPEAKAKKPEAKAKKPEAKAKEPEAKAKKPEAKAKEPEAKAKKPEAKAKKPEAKTKKPEAKAKKPEAKTKKPEAKAKKPEAKTKKPEAKTKKPEAKTKKPAAKTKEPEAKTKKPEAKTKKPEAKTKEPEAKTKEPEAKTKKPEAKAKKPEAKSKDPKDKSKDPKDKSKDPKDKSKDPKAKSKDPKDKKSKDAKSGAGIFASIGKTISTIRNLPTLTREAIAQQFDTTLTGKDMPIGQIIYRVFRDYTFRYWKPMAFSAGTNLIVASATGLTPFFIQQAVDKVFTEHDAKMLIFIPILIIGAAIIKGVATFAAGYSLAIVERRMMFDVQTDVFSALVNADLAFVEKAHSGSHMMIFMHAARGLQNAIGTGVVTVMRQAASVVALIVVMFFLNLQFALIYVCIMFPAMLTSLRKMSAAVKEAAKSELTKTGNLLSGVTDMLIGLRVIKAYNLEDNEIDKTAMRVQIVLDRVLAMAKTKSIASPFTETLAGVAVGAIIFYGGILSINGLVTTGEFVGFVTALLLTYQPLKGVTRLHITLLAGFMAARRVFAILDMPREIRDKPQATNLKVGKGEITFEDVAFTYEGANKPAIENISFKIPGGKNVALVGPSGAGKTTLINLLPRFFDASAGKIYIDGKDIRDVRIKSLRAAMSLVTQEPFLFDDTIYNNILIGRRGATKAEVETAAKDAGAHDFIAELSKQYEESVGQGGKNLSGGQRQRVAIARAMIKNAPILLLDEATSALDTASEEKIQAALARLLKGRTALIIAHRLTTIINADFVVVVNKGRIVQQGTHKELFQQDGLYRRLFEKQFQTFVPLSMKEQRDVRDVYEGDKDLEKDNKAAKQKNKNGGKNPQKGNKAANQENKNGGKDPEKGNKAAKQKNKNADKDPQKDDKAAERKNANKTANGKAKTANGNAKPEDSQKSIAPLKTKNKVTPKDTTIKKPMAAE